MCEIERTINVVCNEEYNLIIKHSNLIPNYQIVIGLSYNILIINWEYKNVKHT